MKKSHLYILAAVGVLYYMRQKKQASAAAKVTAPAPFQNLAAMVAGGTA